MRVRLPNANQQCGHGQEERERKSPLAKGALCVLTLLKGCTVFEPTVEDIWSAYKDKYGVYDGVDLTSSSEEEIESSEDESE